jgi:hypothetical protein
MPYPQYPYGIGENNQTTGSSKYNSLQIKVQRRFTNGFSALVSYTLAKMESNVDEQQGWFDGGTQNTFNHAGEWSVSSLSIPQILTLSGLYDLPFGKGKAFVNHGVSAYILGGFSLSAILHYQGGSPLSIGSSINLLPINSGGQRPTLVPGQPFKAHWSGKFNPSTDVYANNLAAYDTPVMQFGNAPRVIDGFRTFAYYDEDLSLKKEIPIYGRFHATLAVDAFNVFNRTQFGSPNLYDGQYSLGGGGNTSYGQIGYQGNLPRVLQGNFRLEF